MIKRKPPKEKMERRKKYWLSLNALLIASGFSWGIVEYAQSETSETKIQQYEQYLSKQLVQDIALLLSNTHQVSSSLENVIKNKQMSENEKSVLVGKLFAMMDIAQRTEDLAVAIDQFKNQEPAYNMANVIYVSVMYLSLLDSSTPISSFDLKKLQSIQEFIEAWKSILKEALPELQSKEGAEKYFSIYGNRMVAHSDWIEITNQLDQKTLEIVKDKGLEGFKEYMLETTEEITSKTSK